MLKRICLVAGLLIITGAGCSTIKTSILEKRKNSFAATSSSIFNDQQADFSFEYPSSWVISGPSSSPGYPASHIWKLSYQSRRVIDLMAPSYEPAFDSCLAFPDNLADLEVFPTNDSSTTVREELCGGVSEVKDFKNMSLDAHFKNGVFLHAYIYWLPGIRLTPTSGLPVAWEKNPHIMLMEDLNTTIGADQANLLTKGEFLEILRRLAGSIKLKYN